MGGRGKKRPTREPEPEPRLRRVRVNASGLAFDLTTPSPDTMLGVTVSHDRGDILHVELCFSPPLEKIYGSSTVLSVTHLQSRRTDTRISILPHTDDKRVTEKIFLEFVTHVARMTDPSRVGLVYLDLENVQMRGDTDVPVWKPRFNLGLGFYEQLFPGRYRGLPFFPPDTQGPVDLALVPQGRMITHKPSGGITGRKVPNLLGYYASEEGDPFEAPTGWKAVSVRFGRQTEAIATLMYLKKHPERTFQEIGFLSSEHGGILDGAQCDGVVEEDDVRFAIEFKASRFNCRFEGSYIAQCIWEMGCGFPSVDLVRYCERQVREGSCWEMRRECREIRFYRDLDTEQKVIALVQKAAAVKRKSHKEFFHLINTPPYVEMRKHLDNLAEQANEHAEDIPVDDSLIESLQEYQKNALVEQDLDNVVMDPLLDRIEKRQAVIFSALQENRLPSKEICEQIHDYTDMLKPK